RNTVLPPGGPGMRATTPLYGPRVELAGAGEPFPREVRREHAVGMPDECAPLIVFLASDAGVEITGQAIGIGGDKLTLYTHPAEASVVYRDGGWNADQIAEAWRAKLAPLRQGYGMQLPPLELE